MNLIDKKNYLLSIQYKKALFFAYNEAKKTGLSNLTPTCLLYGLLKVESSLGSSIFNKLSAPRNLSRKKILANLKLLIQQESYQQILENSQQSPTLNKSVRQILFFSICQSKSQIITTDDLFLAMLSNQKIQKLIHCLIFEF